MTTTAAQMTDKGEKPVDGDRVAQRRLHWTGHVETSFVPAGDNAGESKVLMTKGRKDGFIAKLQAWGGRVAEKMGYGAPRTLNQILAAEEFNEQFWKLRWAFTDSVESIMCCADPAQMAEMMAKTAGEFSTQVKALISKMAAGDAEKAKTLTQLLERMTADADALKTAGGAETQKAALALTIEELDAFDFVVEAPGGAPETTTTEEQPMTTATAAKTQPATTTPDANAEALKAIQAQNAEVLAALKATQDQNAALAKRLESAEAKANALESDLSKEKESKQDSTFKARAKVLALGDNAKVAGVLKTAYGVSAEAGKALEDVLEGCAKVRAVAEKYAGRSIGLGHEDAEDGNGGNYANANEEITAKAKALMKADDKLTLSSARKAVMASDPELKARAVARQ